MKKKYLWDWRVMLLGVGGLAIVFIMAIFANPSHPQIFEFLFIFSVVILFLFSNFTIGTYGLLDEENNVLSRTDYFFYTKKLSVEDIKTIYYRPTWIMGGFARSLYIVGSVDGEEKVIEFPNVGWYEPVLAQIVVDLKKLNSSIELDEHTKVLVRKYENIQV